MPSKTASADEWTEVVGASFEDDYSIVVEDAGIYLAIGDRPTQPVAGLPLSSGAIYSAEIDRGERVYVRSQTDVDATVRVVPSVRIDGSNERAVSVTASVSTDTYDRGGDFSSSSGYPLVVEPPETIQQLLLPVVEGEVEVVVQTTDGDTVTFPVDTKTELSSYSANRIEIRDSTGMTPRVEGAWAGE